MIMLRITATRWVAADQIAEIAAHIADETVAVRLKTGMIVQCDLQYDHADEFAEQLADKVNHAVSAMSGIRHD